MSAHYVSVQSELKKNIVPIRVNSGTHSSRH